VEKRAKSTVKSARIAQQGENSSLADSLTGSGVNAFISIHFYLYNIVYFPREIFDPAYAPLHD
jgi:hypothetical protein